MHFGIKSTLKEQDHAISSCMAFLDEKHRKEGTKGGCMASCRPYRTQGWQCVVCLLLLTIKACLNPLELVWPPPNSLRVAPYFFSCRFSFCNKVMRAEAEKEKASSLMRSVYSDPWASAEQKCAGKTHHAGHTATSPETLGWWSIIQPNITGYSIQVRRGPVWTLLSQHNPDNQI